ncbi:GH1 family beta-glucosidase [Gaiella sp.]|jgi:beta-glucosidase|uniref:GH1 family beta-glucosidase n=1 Tax=Gaiella sp. TaxID=2663207 RepID=UPI002E34697D|nr:GH1 family beta-glucosidase [Gaiella sp.]HEX5582731.1 GH1 family beta-glucosidase [Gaiella sp.]
MERTPDREGRAFPPGFVWGAATAAYQTEGAATEDGRGESIWDRFTTLPGRIANGDTGRVACDSYHRYAEDVRLMRNLGLGAYRFSVAWPRILPEGRGRVNEAGLDFYDRLVDELLAAGIEPFATLYHWDLPQALEDRGGWPARDTVDAFAEYVEVVVERLSDRVSRWITQNEPWVVSWLGYGRGEHAPGRRSDRDALAAAHHVLLSHGRAVEVIRRTRPSAQVGITIDVIPIHPLTGSDRDARAAREEDGFRNRWILDPVLRGAYPEDMVRRFERILPPVLDGDLEAIAAPLDFLGVNYYRRHVVAAGPHGPAVVDVPDGEHTEVGWEVYPEGLHELLVRLHEEYAPPPLFVTENGAAFGDVRTNGTVDDPRRAAYLDGHLDAVARAIDDGVRVDGYFVWSLLDNFEWARGYTPRFGLVYVDYGTLERVPKESYHWYRDFIARQRNGVAPTSA